MSMDRRKQNTNTEDTESHGVAQIPRPLGFLCFLCPVPDGTGLCLLYLLYFLYFLYFTLVPTPLHQPSQHPHLDLLCQH